jgi:hypothetical protein
LWQLFGFGYVDRKGDNSRQRLDSVSCGRKYFSVAGCTEDKPQEVGELSWVS